MLRIVSHLQGLMVMSWLVRCRLMRSLTAKLLSGSSSVQYSIWKLELATNLREDFRFHNHGKGPY